MSEHKLDRSRPYSKIYGHSVAGYYQDGRYFTGSGFEVSPERAAEPHNMTQRELDELKREADEADEEVVKGAEETKDEGNNAKTNQGTEDDNPSKGKLSALPDPEKVDDPEWQKRFKEAMNIHHRTLKDMAAEQYRTLKEAGKADGVPSAPFTGEDSKVKNARWLATYAG